MTSSKSSRMFRQTSADPAVAEFIRTNGITRCPTACVLPTQGSVAAADRAALEAYAVARNQLRQARAAARARSLWAVGAPLALEE